MLNETVVLLFYRRPELLQQVYNIVAAARPARLLLIADGPRNAAEQADCDAARAVVANVDWPCDVQRLYADRNMGLRARVASGLDWVFAQVDRAIILEDDCLPDPSFFEFASVLLDRYADDERVFGIAAGNHQFGRRRSPYSYFFSGYCGIWGWATWKRAWQHYDVEMRDWPTLRDSGFLDSVCQTARERRYWRWIFDDVHAGRIDTWDFQLLLAMWRQHALFVTPEVNLVSNLGFGIQGTHTRSKRNRLSMVPTAAISNLEHPTSVHRNHDADRHTFHHVFHGYRPIWARKLVKALRAR